MANDWSTVDCVEESKTATESYDDDKGIMKASVVLRCRYEDRHDLVADICGGRKPWPKGAAGAVPTALTASIVPVEVASPRDPTAGQVIAYDEALVTVGFSTEVKDVASESIEPYTEFMTLDHRNFAWGSGAGQPLSEEEAPGRLVRGINFVRTEYNQTSLPAELLSLIGNVNASPVTGSILALTFAAETLLYAPPVINYKQDSTNLVKFEVTKKFTWNQNGWNAYYRGASSSFQRIYRRGTGTPHISYPISDLAPLLT